MHVRRPALTSALVAGTLLTVAACSQGKVVSNASLSARVAQQQRMRTPDLTVGDVTCTKLLAKLGATAVCTVHVDTVDLTVQATYNGPDAVTLLPTRAAIDLVRAVQDVKARLPAGAGTDVACGPTGSKVLVLDPGATFTCTYTFAAAAKIVTFRVLDVDGNVKEVS